LDYRTYVRYSLYQFSGGFSGVDLAQDFETCEAEMIDPQSQSTRQLTTGVAVMKNLAGSVAAQQLQLIAELDERRIWRADGARSMAEWVSAQFGISQWAARRWIAAAHALAELPEVRRALRGGHLSLDKVLELTRLATPDTETELIAWAHRGVGRRDPPQGRPGAAR
ncbi:MAG: DUF222 domain-containing protein, partial [Actinomycetota bacterium]